MKKAFLIFFAALFLFSGCSDDDNDVEVGDVILKDGKTQHIEENENFEIDNKNPPIGVVFDVQGDYALVLGLEIEDNLSWVKNDTSPGNSTSYEAIVCTPSTASASSASFSGDTDGSDNFSAIKNVTKSDSTDFPAFNFAESYTAADGNSGWYVPSVAELATLFKNKSKVDETLQKLLQTDDNPINASTKFFFKVKAPNMSETPDTTEEPEESEKTDDSEEPEASENSSEESEESEEQNNSENSSQEPQIFWTSSIKYADIEFCNFAECIKFDATGSILIKDKTEKHSVLVIRRFDIP